VNISGPFIRRPIATSLLSLAVIIAGVLGYAHLPVAALPQVEFPTISVSAGLPGASPETMASSVATPLERQFGRIAGVAEMTSTSQLGQATVTLQFDLGRSIDAASRDVQAAINAARGQLPSNLPNSPSYRRVNPADAPILLLALTSTELAKSQIFDVADTILSQKIAQVEGVGQVFVGGGTRPAVRVQVNPMVLATRGLSLEDVRASLRAASINMPKGELSGERQSFVLKANDQLLKADDYRSLVIAYRNGAPVRLGDIGEVFESVEDVRASGLSNNEPAVVLVIFRQPGANVIATSDQIKALLPELRASIPPSIRIKIAADPTQTIRASVHDIQLTLALTIGLVVLVIFLFLRNVWATVIPSIAVPLSLLGTFGIMYLLGFSLDNFSLMALTVATGFVVDDAIVVIENISRHMEMGEPPYEAALKGSREVGFTVLSMSVSLVAVFLPILLMGGIVGRLFREFAATLSIAIAVSLCVSLTTTPMMCARFLRRENRATQGRFQRTSERAFAAMLATYDRGLRWVLKHQPAVFAMTVATLFLSVYLFIIIPKGFFPQQDTGRLAGTLLAAEDVSSATLAQKQRDMAAILMKDPAIDSVTAFVGGGGATNTGRLFISLKPWAERDVTADQVMGRLRGPLSTVPGASLFLQPVQDVRMGGRPTGSQYQYTLQSADLLELTTWAPRLLRKLRTVPELRDVTSDQLTHGLQTTVVIDRDTASRLGVTPQAVDDTLYDAFGQRQVSTQYLEMNQHHVVLEVLPEYRESPEALKSIYVHSSKGPDVPLSAFTRFEPTNTTLAVNHQGQFPAVTISFNLAPRIALSDATTAIEAAKRDIGLPAGVHADFAGTAAAFRASLANEPLLILAALITVYVTLGVLYESTIHPVTILSTLPSAGVGALLALLATRTEFSVIALVGVILLVGIVKKNAIMMIDFALDVERRENLKPEEAIYKACLLRFRPIMMTTMAALFGSLPLALGAGTGSELRRPLGISIVGGLLVSQFLTLYTTPVVYLVFERLQAWVSRMRHAPLGGKAGGLGPGEGPAVVASTTDGPPA
jgi:hydrophobe/amphiphile efflux-1 (HAE1) family protein